MLINEQENKLTELSSDEYFYLSENLDFIDSSSVEKAVRYIVISKKRKLLRIVRQVLASELDERERGIALDYWARGIPVNSIVENRGIPRSSVYRQLDNAKKKLQTSLKYVLLYDSEALPASADELLAFIKKGDYVES